MNILVTGSAGQLGLEMRRVAAEQMPQHHWRFTDVAELDITDAAAVRRAADGVDAIVNCAAYTNVDQAEVDTELARRINSDAVRNLALAAAETGALLIHVSTDYVFGGTANTPYTEDSPTCPLGVYGATKLAGEQAIAAAGCRALILRTAWLWSVHGNNFVKTMQRLMRERDSLRVVIDQVGSPTFAGDLADVIGRVLALAPAEQALGIYHYTNEGVCSWYDFAMAIRELIGATRCDLQPCRSSEYPSRVTRPAYSVLDKSRIRRELGIRIPHWRSSLQRILTQNTLP
ncbi:MAG: dTDP-4-dehydrorhamnose reductase [Akkermansia sp.]